MDSQWLKAQLQIHSDKSKSDLAQALGLEPPAVSKMLNGTRQIKAQEYLNMRRFFGMPVDGERAVKGGAQNFVIRPLINEKKMKERDFEDGQWVLPASLLQERTETASEHIRIFKITDNFMEPEFRKNEHVLVDMTDQKPSPTAPFVVSDGFGHMVRTCAFVPQSKPPQIKISAHNSSIKDIVVDQSAFVTVGRVIAKLQWL